MQHYIAIDLESWVYPSLSEFRRPTSEERKSLDDGYIIDSTRNLLALLSDFEVKLTFFIIAEIYEWYPHLVDEINNAGHEIGYYTHTHKHIYNREILQEEISKSSKFIARFSPKGFQAPEIIFPEEGYKVLANAGFEYSSSIYLYTSNAIYFDGIREIPVSTFKFWGYKRREDLKLPRKMGINLVAGELPFGSSYFMAILGKWGMKYFLRKYEMMCLPAVMFIHNWQIFPPQKATFPTTKYLVTHPQYLPYTRNIKGVFTYLLENFKFGKLSEFRWQKNESLSDSSQ